METYQELEQNSHVRCNIIHWMDIPRNAYILELGELCQAITQYLTQYTEHLTSVKEWDESLQNMQYDYIFLWGHLPAMEHMTETECLSLLIHMLRPGGKLVLAVNNKYGLRYWAGCKEEGQDSFFTSLTREDSIGVSKTHLEQLLSQQSGVAYRYYYPYPDYKFPSIIYSDDFLPRKGELVIHNYPYHQERLHLFQESRVYDNLIEDQMFPLFANSFLVLIEGE